MAQARAALETARKALDQALAMSRSTVAAAKANRYKLMSAMADVKNQVAGLRGAIARYREVQAAERLAKAEADRYSQLASRGSVTQEQADIRRTDYEQAQVRVRQALEDIHRIRAGLELPEEPPPGQGLRRRPARPGRTPFERAVRAVRRVELESLAQLGLPLPKYYEPPTQFIESVKKMAPDGDIDVAIEQTVTKAPNVESARAQIAQADQALAQAELELSYCEIPADIDGFISNRNVNPGDRVATGQRLMAIRSFDETWIDANFKETQLEPIRIGQPVDLYVDAYPGKVFRGRVTGFNPGTGASTVPLLRPERHGQLSSRSSSA